MAIYAIGDLQGCYDPFCRLLDKLKFDPLNDRLWLVGDLVNRGPNSLACLRAIKQLDKAVICVLGNHDITLLLAGVGLVRQEKNNKDNLEPVLAAPDREELLNWLRQQPLIHYDSSLNTALVHAGLAPQWSISQAIDLANEVHAALRSDDYKTFLQDLFGDKSDYWRDHLTGRERLRVIVNFFTRVRCCHFSGKLDFGFKKTLQECPEHLIPWFRFPQRKSLDTRIIFGHWAALGCYREANVIALDSGCVWGNQLTAIRVDTETESPFIQIACSRQ